MLLATDVGLVIEEIYDNDDISMLPTLFRCLRLIRVLKFVSFFNNFLLPFFKNFNIFFKKKIRTSKTIKVLVDTYYYLLPSLANIGALLSLAIFIFAILGLNLFSPIKINSYNYGTFPKTIPNFSSFQGSLMALMM